MMGKKSFGLAAVFILLAATPVLAQTTGGIRGTAVDSEGTPIAGVTVEASGEVLGGADRTTISGTNGHFNFSILPPGRYRITASVDGFQVQTVDDVRVSVDGVATVTFRMVPEAFAGEIMVSGESPIVDVTSASVGAAYDEEFVKDLPTRRNFYDIIGASPGVYQPSGEDKFEKFRISAFGANVQSSSWNIDGVNMTAPEGGYLFFEINPDAIAETQFLGLGAGAQYGSTSGSVYNVVTKSGTNDFHGSASIYFQDDSLVDPNVTVEDAYPGAEEFHVNDFLHLSATLGGPIVRDRFWFFAAYLTTVENISQPYESPALMNDTEDDRYDVKLSWQMNENHRLDVKYGKDETFHPWSYDATIRAPSSWMYRLRDNEIVNGEYSGILSNNTFLQIRGGYWRGDNGDLPTDLANRDLVRWDDYSISPSDLTPGRYITWGGPAWDWLWEQHHDQADVVLTHFAGDFAGDHEFKFGVQYNQGGGTTITYDLEYNYYWYYNYRETPGCLNGTYYYCYTYKWIQNPYMYGGDTTTWSAFASDSWQVSDRLTLDIGIRFDKHEATIPAFDRLDADSNPTGEVIPGRDMFTWNQWSPRLGFAWQVTGDGSTVIRGSIGVYRDGSVSGNWYAPAPEAPRVHKLMQYGMYDPAGPWYEWDYLDPAVDQTLQDGIKGPETNEFALGVEHQIGADMAVGAQFVYKDTKNMIGWHVLDDGHYEPFQYTDPDTGETFNLVDIVEYPTVLKGNSTGPGATGGDRTYQQDYTGFFLTFKKRFSKGWDLMASYNYSKAEGLNTRPDSDASWGQTAPFWSSYGVFGNPNTFANAEGLLASDRPHAFRVSGNGNLGWGVRVSGVLRYQTGVPYNLQRAMSDPSGNKFTLVTSLNDDGNRYPDQTVLDLAIGKHFALGGWGDFSLDLQLLNITNEDSGIAFQTVTFPQDQAGVEFVPNDWLWPRRMTIRAKLSF